MHVAATPVASVPLAAGVAATGLSATALLVSVTVSGPLYRPSPSVLWYMSENIDVDVEFEGIEIETTSNVGITTE